MATTETAARRYSVGGQTYTYEAMEFANVDDEGFLAWLRTAEVGDIFADGECCTRLADEVA